MTTFAMISGSHLRSAFRLVVHDLEVKLKESIDETCFILIKNHRIKLN